MKVRKVNKTPHERILVVWYVSCHGEESRTGTVAIMNDGSEFPIVERLSDLAMRVNTFIIGQLDCCRILKKDEKPAEKQSSQSGLKLKGAGNSELVNFLAG